MERKREITVFSGFWFYTPQWSYAFSQNKELHGCEGNKHEIVADFYLKFLKIFTVIK